MLMCERAQDFLTQIRMTASPEPDAVRHMARSAWIAAQSSSELTQLRRAEIPQAYFAADIEVDGQAINWLPS